MSSFDPFSLYRTPKHRTHHGQIIQQKPNEPSYAITRKEIPRSLSVLQTYGYTIYSPGSAPSNIFSETIFIPVQHNISPTLQNYSLNTNALDLSSRYPFSEILPSQIQSFSIVYTVQNLNVTLQCSGNVSNTLTYKIGGTINTTWTYTYGSTRFFVLTPFSRTSYRAQWGYNGQMDGTYLNYNTAYPEDNKYNPLGGILSEDLSDYASIVETGHLSSSELIFSLSNSLTSSYVTNVISSLFIIVEITYTK